MMIWARITMAAVVMVASAATANEAAGTTHYVSNSGNDAWDGLSPAHRGGDKGPWQTIDKINRSEFEPGDLVLLERGGTWREQLTVPSSGSKGKPLTFGAYGKGPKPLINLAERITEWRVYKGRIYVANVDFDVQQIFLDDSRMLLAHHPNDKHLLADEDSDSRDYLIDHDSGLSREQVEGASIHLLPYYFTVDDSRVISFDGTRMTYESKGSSQPPMKKGKQYYLADKFWMLDAPGEWYYDKGARKLYAWMPDGSAPGQHKIEATHGDYGIRATRKHHLAMGGMEIRNANRHGIWLEDCPGFRIVNMSIHNSGTMKFVDVWENAGDGIMVTGRRNSGPDGGVIINSTIDNSLRAGINGTRIPNLTIAGNTVTNTGLVGSPKRRLKKCGGGITVSGCPNATIRRNRILDCGYGGIEFTHGKDVLIEENYIKDPLWIHPDGGAIKTGHAGSGGSRIVRNITTVSSTNSVARRDVRGIYIDDNSHDIQVLGNTFVNAKYGVQLHNAHDHTIRGNTTYGCTHGLVIQEDPIVNIPGITKNNVFENNIFFSTSTDCVFRLNGRLGHIDFCTYDHNFYSSPNPGNLVAELVIGDVRGKYKKNAENSYDLASWQRIRGMDLHSRLIKQPGRGAPEKNSLILLNPSVETKQFASKGHALPGRNYVDMDGKPVRWPVSVAAYGSKILVWDGT